MALRMEKVLIRRLAEKYGLSEEEAKELYDTVKEDDEFKKLLADLTDSINILKDLPEEGKKALLPVVQSHILSRFETDDIEEFAKKITAYATMLKTITSEDDKKVEELKKEIEELKKTFENLGKQVEEEEKERLWHELQELKKAIIEAKEKTVKVEEKDELDKLEELLTKIESTKEKLKRLGLIKEAEEEKRMDVQEAEELLKKMGYKIEKPPDWHTIQRIVEEEVKKREEQIRKQLEEQLGIQEERKKMLMNLVIAIIEGIVGASTTGGGEAINKFKQGLATLLGGGGDGGAGQPSGEKAD